MKRKIVYEVDVTIKVVESKRSFKLRVDNDIRVKTMANKLSQLMGLDPFATEWAFYVDGDDHYEVPITYTVNQIDFKGGRRCLLGKIMTTPMERDYLLEHDYRLSLSYGWTGRNKITTKSVEVQTDNIQGTKVITKGSEIKTNPVFTYEGIVRPGRIRQPAFKPIDPGHIWDNLKMIEDSKVLRGMNVVGYCKNARCVNYHRWICISLGYGR